MESVNSADISSFEERGFLVVENLFSKLEVEDMKTACHKLVDKLDPEKESPPAFKTSGDQKGKWNIHGMIIVTKTVCQELF